MRAESGTVACAIATFLRDKGSNFAFVVAGGASLHLIHAFAQTNGCHFLPLHHEQSAAMAADGFTRSGGSPGVAIATSGPGATNLITGIAGCYYDSIPTVFITGQVSTTRMVGLTGVRQIGFQETPIVEMVRPITKGAFSISRKEDVRLVLEEAYWLAAEGRPGPVLIDVPDDIQRQEVVWEELEGFHPLSSALLDTSHSLMKLQEVARHCKRPVIVAGSGVVLSQAEEEFLAFIEHWGAPVVLTWGAPHLLPKGHPQRVGLFGTHGSRHANLVIQNADLVLSIGSRLDTKSTGSPVTTFARSAVKVMVDIDASELGKFEHFGLTMDMSIQSDAGAFLRDAMSLELVPIAPEWLAFCQKTDAICEQFDTLQRTGPGINPYTFTSLLSENAPTELDVYVDTGCALPWMMTGFIPKSGQRIMHDFNNTAMGWSLPATIGGTMALPNRSNLCVIGDGSLMMCMHDLVTLSAVNRDARVILIDNSGYSMIRQTQDQWLDSEYYSSSVEGGLQFPDYLGLAHATGYEFTNLGPNDDVSETLAFFWRDGGPKFLRVEIDPSWRVVPQVKYGRPNEDMEPLLPRVLFKELMLIEPLPESLSAEE